MGKKGRKPQKQKVNKKGWKNFWKHMEKEEMLE